MTTRVRSTGGVCGLGQALPKPCAAAGHRAVIEARYQLENSQKARTP
ncbi:hypothetical protein [Streptomyces gilvus]|nr:hypothetical protein [Streptomyces sp. CME 23]MCH5671482.1 hypothetical protein [Streptomyces sp. CME 23]